jgi:hypothetical protein
MINNIPAIRNKKKIFALVGSVSQEESSVHGNESFNIPKVHFTQHSSAEGHI